MSVRSSRSCSTRASSSSASIRGVVEIDVVAVRGGVELVVEDVLRIGEVHDPADLEHAVLGAVEFGEEAGEFDLLGEDGEAEVLLPHGEHGFDGAARCCAAAGGGEADAFEQGGAEVLRLFEQFEGEFGVEGEAAGIGVVRGEAGRDDGGGGLDRIEQHVDGERLLVDGMGEGAPDERIVRRAGWWC